MDSSPYSSCRSMPIEDWQKVVIDEEWLMWDRQAFMTQIGLVQ
jgi:hypothetical protein